MGNVQQRLGMMPTVQKRLNDREPVACSSLNNENEHDIWRDTWIRYFGYSNDVGEALRRHISTKLVLASYALATTYVCADTIHKAQRAVSEGESSSRVFIAGGDAFVWQFFASLLIPSYLINRITYLTRRLVRLKRKKCICKASPLIKYAPLTVGLLAIPLVVNPIDNSVTWLMDNTLRTFYSSRDKKD